MLSSRYQGKAVNALGLLCLMLLVHKSGALQFIVGGAKGWSVPSNDSMNSFNQWAEGTRFLAGDSLLFVYKAGQDSVLQVRKEDYDNCNTASPIAKYGDGHSVFTFNKSGPYYFISGNKDNCAKNEKMIIIVMADRSNHSSNSTNAASPQASPPSPESTGMVPAPKPAGEASPPTESVEKTPTPSPAGTPSKEKNAASSMFTCSIGIIGAVFATSSLALVLKS